MMRAKFLLLYIVALLSSTTAHPGHDHKHEAAKRSEYLKLNPRSLSSCAAQLRSRGNEASNLRRRQSLAEGLRQKRRLGHLPYLKARDLDSVLNTSHQSKDTDISLETDPKDLFADDTSCILQPESTEGPYYVSGELIRSDITNGAAGVPMTLDFQIINTRTCEPISGIYLDIWHCNATGVYSGIIARGNGDSRDSSNLDNTAFRGLQQTDAEGVAQFETIYPGHYRGRTTHIHILTHHADSATLNADNNTLSGLTASHTGQIYFDESLQSQIETLAPYTANTQPLTRNADDGSLSAEARIYDPIVEYVLLGQAVSDGILGWISIGIDPTETRTVRAQQQYTGGGEQQGASAGPVQTAASGGGGGSGGGSSSDGNSAQTSVARSAGQMAQIPWTGLFLQPVFQYFGI